MRYPARKEFWAGRENNRSQRGRPSHLRVVTQRGKRAPRTWPVVRAGKPPGIGLNVCETEIMLAAATFR